ncbi:MAG: hypothetical protein QF824_03985 [Candidatus Woesearchaeota archaeon]|jgi:hypothetical protein|nr:hypothetical protein [Candidatus Woesearchaeota archaeon]|tara:strand:- start:272 stop:613 length:342 start_codon:yes stop_codon:yes gene_type:complete
MEEKGLVRIIRKMDKWDLATAITAELTMVALGTLTEAMRADNFDVELLAIPIVAITAYKVWYGSHHADIIADEHGVHDPLGRRDYHFAGCAIQAGLTAVEFIVGSEIGKYLSQ